MPFNEIEHEQKENDSRKNEIFRNPWLTVQHVMFEIEDQEKLLNKRC